MMWCGGFYTEYPEDDFPKAGKESGGYREGGLEGICDMGRTGDHMLTHFQCDMCNFKNMKGRYMNRLR